MTGQQQPFGIAAREQQRLAYLNANRDTLTAAAKQHGVDVAKAVSAALAGLARLAERIDALEQRTED